MSKERIQLIVIGVGVVILLALVSGNLKKKPAKATAQESVRQAQSESAAPEEIGKTPDPAQPDPAADESELNLQKERMKLDWGRDPFSGSGKAKDYQRATLSLKGISFGKDKNGFAFINSEIVKKGDTIGEYEVTEIQKDRVLLRKGQQSFYLVMPRE